MLSQKSVKSTSIEKETNGYFTKFLRKVLSFGVEGSFQSAPIFVFRKVMHEKNQSVPL